MHIHKQYIRQAVENTAHNDGIGNCPVDDYFFALAEQRFYTFLSLQGEQFDPVRAVGGFIYADEYITPAALQTKWIDDSVTNYFVQLYDLIFARCCQAIGEGRLSCRGFAG